MERRYENCSGTASSEDVGPCPLVQIVIDVIYVTALKQEAKKSNTNS